MTTVHMKIKPDKKGNTAKPCIILFDSLDGRFHDAESEIRDLMYFEYAEIGFDDKYQIPKCHRRSKSLINLHDIERP